MPDVHPNHITTPGQVIAGSVKAARDREPLGKLDWKTVAQIIDENLAAYYGKEMGAYYFGEATKIPPTPFQVTYYAKSMGYTIDGDDFCDFYESKGWKVGKTPMKNWQAACRTWARKDARRSTPKPTIQRDYTKI